MPEPRRTRLPAPKRRAIIEAAAAQLFAERGYAATRLEDIALAATVTKPVLYRHFASKKSLYLHLLAGHREQQVRSTARATAGRTGDQTGGEPLAALLDGWFAEVHDHPQTWLLIFRDTTGDAEIQAARLEAQAGARAGILAFLSLTVGERFSRQELETMAELLRGAMAGLALWSIEHPDVPRAMLADLVARAVWGLTGQPPRGPLLDPRDA
jgi:AcrR family transcriptional regulator